MKKLSAICGTIFSQFESIRRVGGKEQGNRTRSGWIPVVVAMVLAIGVLTLGARASSDSSRTITEPADDATTEVAPRVALQFRLAEREAAAGLTEAVILGSDQKVWLHKQVELSNEHVLSARVVYPQVGTPAVELLFTDEGGERFTELTRDNIMKMVAILVDGSVIVAPRIMAEISGNRAQVTGSLSHAEAERIATGLSKQPWPKPIEDTTAFGPVIELTVNGGGERKSFCVDFDKARLFDWPQEAFESLDELLKSKEGADAVYDSDVKNLFGRDMLAIETKKNAWSMPAKSLVEIQRQLGGNLGTPCNMSAKGELPATFIIQTREGGQGILQITDLVDSPKGIKIRYKLLQREESGQKDEMPLPELRAQTPPQKKEQAVAPPSPLDMAKAEAEVRVRYTAASPEIQEHILWTARQASRPSANNFAWQHKGTYEAPDFDAFFADDSSGGAALDALWKAKDKDSRKEDEILDTVRSGLRRTHEHRTSILRWIGNKYIWGKSPQHPYAIEIMYHAADFSGERADPYGTRHYAVYFGLSVVRLKPPPILRTLADLCMRIDDPNDLGRVAWGAKSQKAELIAYLRPYQESNDPAIRAKAEVCRKIFLGELKAFSWARDRAKAQAEEKYTEQLPEIKDVLMNGSTAQRKAALKLILTEQLTLIMDDAFISAFAACSEDPNAGVRNSVAKLAGNRWVWSAQRQQPEAISLMLRLSNDENREVRYSAVYYGLSTVRNKSTEVIRRLLEMAFKDREPNLYGRIAWGLKRDRKSVAAILEGYIKGGDADAAGYAREVFKDMAGKVYRGPNSGTQTDATVTDTNELDRSVTSLTGLGTSWSISEGKFDITDTAIEATGTENCIWLTTPYEDFEISFHATKSAKSDFRVNIGAPSPQTTRKQGFFYQVLIPWEGGDSRVDYFTDGRCTHIKRGFKNIVKPRYHVRMKVKNGLLRVWIDNEPNITCQLPNYKNGFIGFGTMTGVRVEDLEISIGVR